MKAGENRGQEGIRKKGAYRATGSFARNHQRAPRITPAGGR